MILLILAEHLIWSRRNSNGGTTKLYYYDSITWIVGGLALAWLIWYLVSRYRRLRSLRRVSRRANHASLKQAVSLKNELSSRYLRPGFSGTIHAVGIGIVAPADDYCIQVFISDPNQELWTGAGATPLPDSYRGVPIIPVEMAAAGFLSDAQVASVAAGQYANGIREHQDVIIGGISGAHTNLTGQSGTIGYFCTRRSLLRRRMETYLLSNSHVFADLRKTKVDEADLIVQPSPGERANNRPIAALVNFSALKFDDIKEPNHVDAAIAKLWKPQRHTPLIPLIGAVKGYVETKNIEIGEAARKFGRTTGYTEGRIFSIHLDIWIRYDRTGQSAFFQDQYLIEPASPNTEFVSKGDSGSLLVDAGQNAIGLIFAGASGAATAVKDGSSMQVDPAKDKPKIQGYGVANPIAEVMDRFKIELLID